LLLYTDAPGEGADATTTRAVVVILFILPIL
jgi:hypothetical protein